MVTRDYTQVWFPATYVGIRHTMKGERGNAKHVEGTMWQFARADGSFVDVHSFEVQLDEVKR